MTRRETGSVEGPTTIDPDVATVLLLVFSGITAGGWVLDFLERHRHRPTRRPYRRPAGRTVDVRVTTWSANLKELRAQFEAVQRLVESAKVDRRANPIRIRVDFKPADMELMRRQISALTKLVKTSVDAASRLMREATRSDYFDLPEDSIGLMEAHRAAIEKAVSVMWGSENLATFLAAASTALSELNQAAGLIETYILGDRET